MFPPTHPYTRISVGLNVDLLSTEKFSTLTTPIQARLTVEFLSNRLPKRRCILLPQDPSEPHIVMPHAPATTPCALVSLECYMPTNFRLDDRLTPQTNTSPFSVLCPHSHAFRETSQKVTHPKTTPSQARFTMEF
ncbi:hypothetical protein L195_g043963 [Trifolium pratense]|uniref:Uncharacterized protein n=1 Tax=Trifolium pratense TaxID=57577 RepID=A0A2K3MAQ2_TRIPR|nr:hypothetical protein L195_g043963 [Trifolium pratense]